MPDGLSADSAGERQGREGRRISSEGSYLGPERRTATADRRRANNRQYSTFFVDDHFMGIEVSKVQEVMEWQEMTPVPLAPAVIGGLINLRGEIVTALDLRSRLGFPPRPSGCARETGPMNVVIYTADGPQSILVDGIGDVVEVSLECFASVPQTVDAKMREVMEGVYRLPERLLLVLNPEALIRVSDSVLETFTTPTEIAEGNQGSIHAPNPREGDR